MAALWDTVEGQYQALLGPFVGPTELGEFATEWLPVLLTVIAPIICMPFVALGICGVSKEEVTGAPAKQSSGVRLVLRRMIMAVRADLRAGKEVKHTKLLGMAGFKHLKTMPAYAQPTAAKMEAGLQKTRVASGQAAKAGSRAGSPPASAPKSGFKATSKNTKTSA
jgi:hypothetical protein